MAGIGAADDPRLDNDGFGNSDGPTALRQKLHDPSIPIEEYLYYAKITRAEEDRLYGPGSDFQHTDGGATAFVKEKILRKRVQRRVSIPQPRLSISAQGEAQMQHMPSESGNDSSNEKANKERIHAPVTISDEEWVQASRAARTATWSAVFYLITTDILGPFSTGYAFSQMGLGPGVALFTVFGALAAYSGYQLWRMYLQLDSDRYPMKGYGDIAFRIYGAWFRHTCNALQSFQFFLNVALIVLTSGQSISQLSKGKLCFIACMAVCTIFGCLVGQIRTLQRFGWLASWAVFLNLFIIFATMGVMAHSPPNYALYAASNPDFDINNPDPIKVAGGSPPGLSLNDNVNGLMNAVFSFGGATLFVELMAEMRRPMDFWKGLLAADILIYLCYMVYGLYTYCMQGQYAYNVSYQGVSPYGWQTACNIIGLITGLIAAVLYGNIGVKVLYNNVGRDLFKFPILESKRGKWIFVFFVPLYWVAAWVISQSVPQINSWIVLVGAGCILQFTYTFPPFMMLGLKIQRDAILPNETFDPATGQVTHVDSGMKRWIRGFKKELAWNLFDLFFYLGSCVTCILGLVAAFTTMVDAYKESVNLTAWKCESPTG
ncbi:transmembrane amino acid transporter protein-domain-containing protein [Exophiala viscosa]|uniref:Transmembrane amino acid transporter protein-domain-containing protein n=1 Tax=Exophiala viscosa TaxID=2486360 RepID=A0AAN6IB25_9EURO|nr:transmembrane amino acid transporter protein-domain-containing protein [Exophiala viscosa]